MSYRNLGLVLILFGWLHCAFGCENGQDAQRKEYIGRLVLHRAHYGGTVRMNLPTVDPLPRKCPDTANVFFLPLTMRVFSGEDSVEFSVDAANVREMQAREFSLKDMKLRIRYEILETGNEEVPVSYLEIRSPSPVVTFGYSWESPIWRRDARAETSYELEKMVLQ